MEFKTKLELSATFAIKTMWVALILGPVFWMFASLFKWSGMSNSEIATWVQALGSVAAILSAVWIARRDSRIRFESETKTKRDAAERSIFVAKDARMRADAAIKSAKKMKITGEFIEAITKDLEQSQQHMKDVLSIQGIDSSVFTQIFIIRISVERIPDSLLLLTQADYYCDRLLADIDAAVVGLESVRDKIVQ